MSDRITASPDTKPTIPEGIRDLFDEPALGHVSYLNKQGQVVTFPLWVDFDGEHLLTSSAVGSRKGRSFRERPHVSVSIVSTTNPWRWLSVSGRVSDIQPDQDLGFIDKMSRKYTGQDYERRTPREVFTIDIDRVSSSESWG
jgi:PPOX class probable F420-dependent enzyme